MWLITNSVILSHLLSLPLPLPLPSFSSLPPFLLFSLFFNLITLVFEGLNRGNTPAIYSCKVDRMDMDTLFVRAMEVGSYGFGLISLVVGSIRLILLSRHRERERKEKSRMEILLGGRAQLSRIRKMSRILL